MLKKKVQIPTRADSPDRWVISYADLLTLLLGFFIVLYSQSTLNVAKFEKFARSVAIAFHGTPSLMMDGHGAGTGLLPDKQTVVPPARPTPSVSPATLRAMEEMSAAMRKANAHLVRALHLMIASQKVRLDTKPLSIRITLNSRILFPSGSDTLSDSARKLLGKVAGVIRSLPDDYPVIVQGYTNKVPIDTKQFPSNWALSTGRAISAARLFMSHGVPGTQLSVQGFSKFHPLVHGGDQTKALKENRRVEIVILAPAAARAGSLSTGATAPAN